MGSCFSSSSSVAYNKSAARIISLEGSLTEYSAPVTVFQVLGDSWCSCFVCDADKLHYDTYIPPMGPLEWLHEEHIYFILPFSMIDYPLTGPDMAALACKASEALNNAAAAQDKHGRQTSCSTIQVLPVDGFTENSCFGIDQKKFQTSSDLQVKRLNSIVEISE